MSVEINGSIENLCNQDSQMCLQTNKVILVELYLCLIARHSYWYSQYVQDKTKGNQTHCMIWK